MKAFECTLQRQWTRMFMAKQRKSEIDVRGTRISVRSIRGEDYISLTDMLKAKEGDFFISDWLRNRNTVEFLGIWESVHNPDFNYGEFATIKSLAGLNSYKISAKDWVEKTSAIGLSSSAGRYGGTFAHKDIAFEFGMWISPEFKITICDLERRAGLGVPKLSTLLRELPWSLNLCGPPSRVRPYSQTGRMRFHQSGSTSSEPHFSDSPQLNTRRVR
jgi:hypothetical protein